MHLTDDQDVVLRQLIAIARDARVDAVVVAGDVYDRAVPPPEAVRLLDDVLAELVVGAKIPVIVTAGNHDSPERLAFGSRLLAAQGLHLFGFPSKDVAPFFDAALGHLHRPQSVGRGSTRYAGALLKYSTDEIGQDRSVTLVDIDAAGTVTTEAGQWEVGRAGDAERRRRGDRQYVAPREGAGVAHHRAP